MPDFSVILQTPEVRSIVQERALERAFHDALFPGLMFRAEAVVQDWPAGVGDTYIASAPGLMAPVMRPLRPGVDPEPQSYSVEQWEAQLQQYAGTIDTHMPTSAQAIVDLFMRNAHQLGLQASQSMNRIARNKLYNAALSGNTVADGAGIASVSLRVKRLNGFTRARNPNVSGASRVRFDTVSATNPLAITIGGTSRNVVGFTPDTAGDEVGPGVLTLSVADTWSDRDPVLAVDRSRVVRAGGGDAVDDISVTDTPKLDDIRIVHANMSMNNVPAHPDGYYHCHLSPESQAAFFRDTELQRLATGMNSVPTTVMYREMAIGMMFNIVFFTNKEAPHKFTVYPYDGTTFSQDDNFAGELYSNGATTGTPIHRALFTGGGGMFEYFQDPGAYITEAGINGITGPVNVVNNGVEVLSDRIQLIIRQPLNRLQDMVSTSWRFVGDWAIRTDAATGDASRFKRFRCLEHAGIGAVEG